MPTENLVNAMIDERRREAKRQTTVQEAKRLAKIARCTKSKKAESETRFWKMFMVYILRIMDYLWQMLLGYASYRTQGANLPYDAPKPVEDLNQGNTVNISTKEQVLPKQSHTDERIAHRNTLVEATRQTKKMQGKEVA